jgi:hypothetical protein
MDDIKAGYNGRVAVVNIALPGQTDGFRETRIGFPRG